jgi:hypothetical protein
MTEADRIAQRVRDAARAAFLLDEARKLDIRVGAAPDGAAMIIAPPRGLPLGVYLSFRAALIDLHLAVVDHILREQGRRP